MSGAVIVQTDLPAKTMKTSASARTGSSAMAAREADGVPFLATSTWMATPTKKPKTQRASAGGP